MSKLPPLPGHPEPHTHCWTSEEIAAIKEYGQQCRDAALDEAITAMKNANSGRTIHVDGCIALINRLK